jgi:hypothetical protein
MKTKFIFQFLLLSSLTSSYCSAQTRVYLSGGANYSFLNLVYNDGEEEEKQSYQKLGYIGGAKVEIPIVPKWSIETGLLYNSHGGSFNNYEEYVDGQYFVKNYGTERFDLKYLTIPIDVKHYFEFRNGLILSGSVGQFTSIGIGQVKYTASGTYEQYDINGNLVNEEEYNEIDAVNWKESALDRVHCGVGFQIGVEYKRFQLSGFYNVGLSSILNLGFVSMKGNTTGLSLAYRLAPK